MPQTAERPDRDPQRIQLGAIIEKLKRRGSDGLSDAEKLFVVEVFRAAVITKDPRLRKVRDDLSSAHLEFCFKLPSKQSFFER
jgi:hypothetical protein